MMPVTLTADQMHCMFDLGTKRSQQKLRNVRQDPLANQLYRSDVGNILGCKGEKAVEIALCTIDLGIIVNHQVYQWLGDNGIDMRLTDGRSVDVKTVGTRGMPLYFKNHSAVRADILILVEQAWDRGKPIPGTTYNEHECAVFQCNDMNIVGWTRRKTFKTFASEEARMGRTYMSMARTLLEPMDTFRAFVEDGQCAKALRLKP